MKTSSSNSVEVVLGVTGSIAAYKACELASLLVKQGLRVTPVLTRSAQELAGAASFEAITGQRAITGLFEPLQAPEIAHIAVARRASLFLIAPATANILAKAAHGIADDWLSTTLLATEAPILFAPAMNTNMYNHPATQANIATLQERGCHFVGPDSGMLACKTEGIGRLIAPQTILEAALPLLDARRDFEGKRVVITSGGTREPIDPVRFIGNRSSGKMGRALAMEALLRKAQVTVISGPSETPLPYGVQAHQVETASEMAEWVQRIATEADVFISAAAVADYRAEQVSPDKIKRAGAPLTLRLVENPDILAQIGTHKLPGQIIVGYAAETSELIGNAKAKLSAKQADFILANQVNAPDSGFGTETLRSCILDAQGGVQELGLLDKADVARVLFDRIAAQCPA